MSYITRDKPIPLYFQLEEILRQKIVNKVYLPGQPIPAETQLVEEYDVSRITVRKAVDNLVLSGLLTRKRGVATYVAEPKITHRIGSIYSSTEEILARGLTPGTEFLEKNRIDPPDYIRRELALDENAKAFRLKRLRFANNEPVAILTSYVPEELAPGLISNEFTENSLYRTLEQRYNLKLSECDEYIEAQIIRGDDARLLGLGNSGPVLAVKRLTYLDSSRAIESLIALYRSDRYKYQVKLKGRAEGRLL
ncbi:MAG: UTRA domain-containing protein [candidate division Zixibacteria bacterium]|nr:UTRA domain-containing protein [candidate division Zixibacteria bacterium]